MQGFSNAFFRHVSKAYSCRSPLLISFHLAMKCPGCAKLFEKGEFSMYQHASTSASCYAALKWSDRQWWESKYGVPICDEAIDDAVNPRVISKPSEIELKIKIDMTVSLNASIGDVKSQLIDTFTNRWPNNLKAYFGNDVCRDSETLEQIGIGMAKKKELYVEVDKEEKGSRLPRDRSRSRSHVRASSSSWGR